MPRRLLPCPEPTPTQPHPMSTYLLRVRLTHAEAEALKRCVARRCLLGVWHPREDDADWLVAVLVRQVLDQQGVSFNPFQGKAPAQNFRAR